MTGDLVDYVENTLDRNAGQIMQTIRDYPGRILARKEYVLGSLTDLWRPVHSGDLPALETGELRPVFGGSVDSGTRRAISEAMSPSGRTADELAVSKRLEIQSLLLYSHSIATPNPLYGKLRMRRLPGPERGGLKLYYTKPTDQEFLSGIYSICDAAALARKGVLYFFDPPPLADKTFSLSGLAGNLGFGLIQARAVGVLDQGLLHQQGLRLIEQALLQLLAIPATSSTTTSMLIPTDLTTDSFIGLLIEVQRQVSDTSHTARLADRDASMLQRILELSLPGVKNISLADVVAIREGDEFAQFRLDMRNAVKDAVPYLGDSDPLGARVIVAEHMSSALARLSGNSRRQILADAIVGDVVAWSVGAAAAGAVAGWAAAAATLLGKAIAELVRKSPQSSQQALRHHYVALADRRVARLPQQPIGLSWRWRDESGRARDGSFEAELDRRRTDAINDALSFLHGDI